MVASTVRSQMRRDTLPTARAMTPGSVVRVYLVIAGLFTLSASVIWGVTTLFLLDAGLDIFEVFIANAAFTAGMVLFEILTGVVADTSGRRRSFLWGGASLLIGPLAPASIVAGARSGHGWWKRSTGPAPRARSSGSSGVARWWPVRRCSSARA